MAASDRARPSDLNDAEWALLAPLLPPPRDGGRPQKWPTRRLVDAVFYLVRSGCAWRMLPGEYPPWSTVYWHFCRWRRGDVLRAVHDRLRRRTRRHEGRHPEPSAGAIDSQAVRTAGAGGPERGYDGGKRLAGRKRHVVVDTGGLLLGLVVHAADLHDRDGGRRLLSAELRRRLPRLQLVWADQAYAGKFREWAWEERRLRVGIIYHPDRHMWRYGFKAKPKGFQLLPRRWVVERTFAWLGQSRRLAKDYERLPATSAAMIYGAMSRLMLRRLAKPAA